MEKTIDELKAELAAALKAKEEAERALEIGKEIRKRLKSAADSVTGHSRISVQFGSNESEVAHWLNMWDRAIDAVLSGDKP